MKGFSCIFAMLVFCVMSVCAQDTESKPYNSLKIGIRTGYNRSVINGTAVYGKWKSGMNIGVVADFSLTETWVVRPGLYLTMKGFRQECSTHRYYAKDFNFLEMPVLVVYKQPYCSNSNFEIQVGPYFSYGLFGKSNSPFYLSKENTFANYKRFDWGANMGFGVDFDHFYIGVSYDLGFVSVIHHALHHCVMANLGYRIL